MISIIIAWKNRDELYRSIDSFINVVNVLKGEVILVNYCGQLDYERLPKHDDLRIVEITGRDFFNKASANNIGSSYAKNNNLFFCDCDIVLELDAVQRCLELLVLPKSFVTIKHVQEEKINAIDINHIQCFGYHMIIKTRDGQQVEIVDFEEDAATGIRNAPGLLFLTQDHMQKINGYSGFMQGWGWEDQDMICRLTLGLGLSRQQHGTLLHLSHDDHSRTKEYPEVSSRWESRDRMFRSALSRYDQNIFLGTLQEDLLSHSTREVTRSTLCTA
ncbi:galactosyltransferase-related protein [Agaribacterium sp. ZY112]|uniref:galactosyltransferase-related protein n=1 Tax=Agaribacterium sp. ZY112 TaxID=3233574 RepID=UPI00352416E6